MATTFSGEAAIEALYIGYFGRAGDPAGVNYWVGQLNGGMSITDIAASFSVQTEATTQYSFLANPNLGGSTAITNFVTAVYQDLFNRAPDTAGQTYWVDKLTAANGNPQAVGQFILDVTTGAQGADATTIQNKVSVGQYFTDQLSLNSGTYDASADSTAHSIIAATTSDTATVTTQETAVDGFISTAGSVGTTLALTAGIDNVTGSHLNITGVTSATAAQNTLNVGDVISPTGSNNSLSVTDTTGNLNAAIVPVLTNVQTLNVTNVSGALQTTTLTGIGPNLTTIGVVGGTGSNTFIGFDGSQTNTFNVTNVTTAGLTEVFTPNAGLTASGAATGSATLNVSGDSNLAPGANTIVSLTGAGATDGFATVTVNSTGSGSNDLRTLADTALKTLNVEGTQMLKVDNSIAFNGGVVNVQAGTDTGGFNLDVSGNAGKVTLVGGTAGTEMFHISEASLIVTGTSLAGGAGTSDTLGVSFGATSPVAADYTALNATTGFEILGLYNTGAITVDDSQITAAFNNHFSINSAFNVAITNMVDNATIDLLATGAAESFTGAVGTNTININEGASTSAGLSNGITVTGFSTVNLTSNGTATNTANFVNSDNTSFHITGTDGLTMTVSAAATTGDAVDASGLSGTFTYTDSGKGDVIHAGSGTTTINALNAAAAVDTITLLSGHTKVDTFQTTSIDSTGTSTIDHVTNFALNQDVLKIAGAGVAQGTELGATAGTGIVATGSFANAAAFIAAANALTTGAVGDNVAWSDGSNTYVAEWTAAAANSVHIVELVGVTSATAISTTAGAGHILIA